MSSRLPIVQNLGYLNKFSSRQDRIVELKKILVKTHTEGIFIAICNEIIDTERCYNAKLKKIVFSLQIRDLNIWEDTQTTKILLSNAPFLFNFFGKEYNPIILRELFENCGLNETNCLQEKDYITFNFDANNMAKAIELTIKILEEKEKGIEPLFPVYGNQCKILQ